jgi:uncharacterized membrane protein YsdA (DUF1294 family)
MPVETLRIAAIVYGIASAITFVVYGLDKLLAVRYGGGEGGRRGFRVAEQTLHLFELLGGWPGALVAQQVLRHKRAKRSFMICFWSIVAAHGVGWVIAAIVWLR